MDPNATEDVDERDPEDEGGDGETGEYEERRSPGAAAVWTSSRQGSDAETDTEPDDRGRDSERDVDRERAEHDG